jgi:hypothetical protein
LKFQIDEVVINGKVLTPSEQIKLFSDLFYTTINYYLMKRLDNDATYIAGLRTQLKDLVFNGTFISDIDRNALLNNTYAKALGYYNEVVTSNRSIRTTGGGTAGSAVSSTLPKDSANFVVDFTGYLLNE